VLFLKLLTFLQSKNLSLTDDKSRFRIGNTGNFKSWISNITKINFLNTERAIGFFVFFLKNI